MRKSKSKITRLTAIVMAGAMVLGLSACGGKSADNGTTAAGNSGTTQRREKPPQHRGQQVRQRVRR